MGAWGEGMQANDTALDAIGCAGLSVGEPRKRKKTLSDLKKGKITVEKLFDAQGFDKKPWIKQDAMSVLGLAEHLFDEGFDIKAVMPLVRKALRSELAKRRLECWVEMENRKNALLRFKARLAGEKVSQELLDQDNEGLLSKMAGMLGK